MRIKARIVSVLVTVTLVMTYTPMVTFADSTASLVSNIIDCLIDEDIDAAQYYNQQLPEIATETCIANMSTEMRIAYGNVVKSWEDVKQYDEYAFRDYWLTDIDNDGSAELLVNLVPNWAYAETHVYQYKNGKTIEIGTFSGNESCHAYPSHNGIVTAGAKRGQCWINLITIVNGALEQERLITYGDDEYYFIMRNKLETHSKWNGSRYVPIYDLLTKDNIINEVMRSSSTEYNPELAYKLMQAAEAAYGKKADVEEYIDGIGIENSESYKYFEDKYDSRYGRDSVAYSIGYNDTDEGRIVTIIIRGSYGSITEMTPDWKSNLHLNEKLLGAPGWHHGFEIASKEVYDKLRERNLLSTNGTKYVITGHSRGAGVGNLLAVRLSDFGVSKENVYDYNFACPDTNRGWPTDWNWNGVHDNIFNIGYCGDAVTKLPGLAGDANEGSLIGLAWGKYGRSVWYADSWNNFEHISWTTEAHDGSNYLRFLSKKLTFDYYRTWDQMNLTQVKNKLEGLLSIFRCPVDVYAKDKNGNVLVSVVDDKIHYYEANKGSVYVVTYGDSKWFFALDGSDMHYELAGTDTGTMNCDIHWKDCLHGEDSEITEYTNVQLQNNKLFSAQEKNGNHILVTLAGDRSINGEIQSDGSVTTADLSNADINVSDCVYNGQPQTPAVSVTLAGATVDPSDYDVKYRNYINPGTATVTITGKNRCAGSKSANFNIIAPPAQAASAPAEITDLPTVKISKPKAAKKAVTVKWKKPSKKNLKKIGGIEIQVATDAGFANIVKSTTAGAKKTSKKIRGLNSKTTYWVRIRAYKNAANGKHVSAWKSKKVKVK